jgi:type IV secretory pathway protease TraF
MKWWLQTAGVAALTTAAILGAAKAITETKFILRNISPSIPLGLYVRTFMPPEHGSIVSIPLPAAMKPYVEKVSPAWAEWLKTHPLMKHVVAMGGDTICRSETGEFTAAGELIGKALDHGPTGVPLPRWSGCVTLKPDEIAVGATGGLDPIDARYWGATPLSEARMYVPLWTTR